jgi:RNA polymerase sigma-70 factor (ECF subfamily)
LSGPEAFDADLAAARTGDEAAIARIYRAHQPRLLRVLRAEVGDAADDVASQTWLEVMGALGRFEGDEARFRGFLFTVARRRVADHRRTRRRRPAQPTEPASLTEAVDPVLDVEGDVLAGLGAEHAVRRITEILSREQAEVVLLRVVADLPVDEVARILGRSAGAVRVQQHRALKRLAQVLASDATGRPAGNEGPLRGDEGER